MEFPTRDPPGPHRTLSPMRTPGHAVDELVALVTAASQADDSDAVRTALVEILGRLEVRRGDPAWTNGLDVIGKAYERLVSGDVRRPLGQFFTPLAPGRVMARWALQDKPTLLTDPGCGSGSLLIAASQERASKTKLLGFDIDPSAIAMAEANRGVRSIHRLELRQLDFLQDEISERPDAVICNPPYTRHQSLSSNHKTAIHESLSARLGVRFSHLASLHVLFLMRALDMAADEARLAFITPAHWLDMAYARDVKRLLLEQAHVEAIVTFPNDQPVFEHALTTASITLIRKGQDAHSTTRVIHATTADPDALAAQLEDPEAGEPVVLTNRTKWSHPARRGATGEPLSAFARVRRGAATGHNAFFVLSERRRRDLGIGHSSVRACLTSPRNFLGQEITETVLGELPDDVPRWLLDPKRPRPTGPLGDYLAYGTALGVRDRSLVALRERAGRPWYRIGVNFEAPILFTYFNRSSARFMRNIAGAVPLNTWLIIEPLAGVDTDDLFEILTSRAVEERLRDDCRIYGNGLWKLEPSELAALPLPRSPRVHDEQINELDEPRSLARRAGRVA